MQPLESTPPKLIELTWQGPFRWPGCDGEGQGIVLAESVAGLASGVYLWTVEYLDGFLIYAAGVTRRPFVNRFREHTRAYRNGIYTLFDLHSLKQGVRKEIWHGFWTKKRPIEKQHEYDNRREELQRATDEQMMTFRVFVASVESVPRLSERIEAAIMNTLYAA